MTSKKIYNKKIKLSTKNGFVLPIFLKQKKKSDWLKSNTLSGLFLQMIKNNNIYHSQISSPNEIVMKKLSFGILPIKLISNFVFNSFIICHGNLRSKDSDHYTLELTKKDNNENFLVNFNNSLNQNTYNEILNEYSNLFSRLNYFPLKMLTRVTDSQHTGSTLPMSKDYVNVNNTNNLGMLKEDKNTHYIDSSILPELPAYPIGLTIMANANYISNKVVQSVKKI